MQAVAMDKAMLNDEWITNGEAPDPEVLPHIPGYHLLVRPVSIKKATKGGIILPDSTVNDISYLTTVGKVLAIGDLAYKDKDKFLNGPWCSVGDYVCYGKHTGQKFFYKGVRMLILFDDQISMVLDDPKTLDPTYNLSN